jgi:Tol biopolymer transport system component
VTNETVDSTWSSNQSGAQWSPDGTQIVLTIHPNATPDFGYAYTVNADGTNLRRVGTFEAEIPGYVIDDEHAAWSPDGNRIAFNRWIMGPDGSADPRPQVIVDLATGAERQASNREVNGYSGWTWSPDGSTILQVPGDGSEDAGKVIEVDPTTGQAHQLGWTAGGAASWQRTAPTN